MVESLEVPGIRSHLYSELGANELRAGRWDRQLECNRQALQLARQAHELTAQTRAHINLSVCFTNRGKLDDAAAHAIEAAALALRVGHARSRTIAINNLGLIRLDQGRAEDARRLLEDVIARCERSGARDVLYETLPSLGRVFLAQGDPARALEMAGRGLALSVEQGHAVGTSLALRVEALARASMGALEEARGCLERANAELGPRGDAYELAINALVRAGIDGTATDEIEAMLVRLGADPELERRRWVEVCTG